MDEWIEPSNELAPHSTTTTLEDLRRSVSSVTSVTTSESVKRDETTLEEDFRGGRLWTFGIVGDDERVGETR